MAQPVRVGTPTSQFIPAAAAAPSPPAKPPEDQIALQTRRNLLLQWSVRVGYQVGLCPHKGDSTDRRERDDKGQPIVKFSEINNCVKMLSVELRHEYPLPADAGLPPDTETPLNVADDPLAGILLKFPAPAEQNPATPAKPRAKGASSPRRPKPKTPRTHE